ncbi:esterase [Pseudoalteromonas sp. BMB]|nr:esterase [Pseudoalteromonas sp. BMB]
MLNRLHKSNGSDEYIVVGITSANRLKDFAPTVNKDPRGPLGEGGGAGKFLDYIHYELIPFVNGKYRSNHNNIILGHSIAGLFVIHAFHARPGLFQAHLAFSPAVWWGNGETVQATKSYLSSENDKPGFLYMNIGGERGSMRKQYDAFSNIVLRNRSTDLVLQLDEFNSEEHNFTLVAGLYNALKELQRYRKITRLSEESPDNHI